MTACNALFRLFYVSLPIREFDSRDRHSILETGHDNNERSQITGVLCYAKGVFAQVLEGPEDAVLTTYARIARDPRHEDCRILFVQPAVQRWFAPWAMAAMALEDELSGELLQFRTSRSDGSGRWSEGADPADFVSRVAQLLRSDQLEPRV